MDDNLPSEYSLLKGHISNILEIVLCVKLKLTTLVVGGVELTKRPNLHHDTAAFTPTATTTATIITTAKSLSCNFNQMLLVKRGVVWGGAKCPPLLLTLKKE